MVMPIKLGVNDHVWRYDLTDFKGRIFFVTDLHGCYDLLHEALRDVSFDSTRDLLFSGGDWTDRGPDSKHVLDYLTEPWIHSVRGNHEQMYIEGFESHWNPNHWSVNTLKAHGGNWIWDLDDLTKILIADVFKALPLGIELILPNRRRVGIVHAEVPYNDWNQFINITKAELEWDGQATAQWSRTWYNKAFTGEVKGVDFVLVGHTPTDTGKVERYGNMVFADGGSFFNHSVNLIELNDEFVRRVKWK
jgi:serine/threonine protein phosphatase 1